MKKISLRISSATPVTVLSVAWLISVNPPSLMSLLQLTPQDALETHGLLALLDWIMPEKDGIEVCREIRGRQGKA